MKISTFIEYLRKNNYSKNTLLTYQNVLNKYLDIFKSINGIKEKLLTEYKNPNTINTHFNVLSAYMKWSNDKRIKKLHKVKLPQIPKIYMKAIMKILLNYRSLNIPQKHWDYGSRKYLGTIIHPILLEDRWQLIY
jgi:integrase/recombinase XerD